MSCKFKFGTSTFDFEEMIVISEGQGWWKLYFNNQEQKLYRAGPSKMMEQHPRATAAYLDYSIEKLLIGEE